MNQLRNVHVYDGTLGQHYTKVHNLSKQEKIDIFGKFSEKLSNPLASRMIQIIIFDLNYPKSGEFTNKDNKNIKSISYKFLEASSKLVFFVSHN